jgi:modulator of FtsH protease
LTAFEGSEWSELFVASAGASAALAGLVFVAVSINIDRLAILLRRSLPPPPAPVSWRLGRQAVVAAGTVPLVIGGASLLAETGGGLYWTAGGIIFAIAGAVLNAWVLMVEILR